MNNGPKKLGFLAIALWAGVALLFDIATFIPFLGDILSPLYWVAFGFYLWKSGYGLFNPRRAATMVLDMVVEMIPALQELPLLTVGSIIVLGMLVFEQKTGIKLPKGGVKGKIASTSAVKDGVRMPSPKQIPFNKEGVRAPQGKNVRAPNSIPKFEKDYIPSNVSSYMPERKTDTLVNSLDLRNASHATREDVETINDRVDGGLNHGESIESVEADVRKERIALETAKSE